MSGPLALRYKDVILRDRTFSDIADHLRWQTSETAWREWDAPWEGDDPEFVKSYIGNMEKQIHEPLPPIRRTLEICYMDSSHIGMVNAYYIDKDPSRLAVGIAIRESRFWGMGLGLPSFKLWLAYQFAATGKERIYCETWSGNTRMIKLAQKCHFTEFHRKPNYQYIRGEFYDGLTFVLGRDTFTALNPDIKV